MRKTIFAINITLDGFADHTAVIADDELHDFYANLLNDVDIVLFGRKTYQLMESFWPNANRDPISTNSMIKYANKINQMQKIVFSKTLNEVYWTNSELNKSDLIETINNLKTHNGKNISIGSLSIATQLTKAGLIDEYWFLVQPIILGNGKRLFDISQSKLNLKLIDSQTFSSGVSALHYQNIKREL